MFWRYRAAHPSAGATVLGTTFLLWAIHHVDYPILRARGIWSPWGYYLDIVFTLGVAAGILLLINSELTDTLRARSESLEHLSRRMVRQHEDERRRLSLALHDATAQLLAAIKLQLGSVAERVEAPLRERIEHTMTLVDTSITGIRSITHGLRPALLDDLGLLPALRSLTAEFADAHGTAIDFEAPEVLPVVSEEGEVALFRALQEGLAKVGRQAHATRVRVSLEVQDARLVLHVRDDGHGIDATTLNAAGRGGLAGMRERVAAVGGLVTVGPAPANGTHLQVAIPVDT